VPVIDNSGKKATPTLRVYIAHHCVVCHEALQIIEKIKHGFAEVDVQVIDLEADRIDNIDGVFSVPTYVLDGRTVFLGNPEAEALERKLRDAMSIVGKETE
jgi:glutaredoxin